jgi:hypothetical protein
MAKESTVDVEFRPEHLTVVALNFVGGDEGSPRWDDGTIPVKELDIDLGGVRSDGKKDRHYGMTRVLRSYQVEGGWSGAPIANERQVSIATIHDLASIVDLLGIDSALKEDGEDSLLVLARVLGANVVLGATESDDEASVPGLLAPSTKLYIAGDGHRCALRISEPHLACGKARSAIARSARMDLDSETKKAMKDAMRGRRGFMSTVYMSGSIAIGDLVLVQPPVSLAADDGNQPV